MLSVAEEKIEETESIERMVYDYKATLMMDAYEEAYSSLTKVPELSEWQT